jgi:hypothetical protein
MYDIPVLEPYAGYLHLTWEQRNIFEKQNFISFYEKPKTPHVIPVSQHDNNVDAVDIKVCTFKRVRAGGGYVAKVESGNPNNIPTWKTPTQKGNDDD